MFSEKGEKNERNYLGYRHTSCPTGFCQRAKDRRAAPGIRIGSDYGRWHGLRRNIARRHDVIVNYSVLIW